MRIDPIYEVNTQQKENPFVMQTANSVSGIKAIPNVTFKDYLASQYQQASEPAEAGSTQHRVASIYGGFFPLLKMRTEEREPTLDTIAY